MQVVPLNFFISCFDRHRESEAQVGIEDVSRQCSSMTFFLQPRLPLRTHWIVIEHRMISPLNFCVSHFLQPKKRQAALLGRTPRRYCRTILVRSSSIEFSMSVLKVLLLTLRPWINQITWPNSCKSSCIITFLFYTSSWKFGKYYIRAR